MCRAAPRITKLAKSRPPLRIFAWGTLAIGLSGCVQEMANQPRVETYELSPFFADGMGGRPQIEGTIARGQDWERSPRSTGKQGKEFIASVPLTITWQFIEQGQKSFGIHCDHCHGPAGYGDGMVVQRGFPKPPSYHIDRLRQAEDGYLFDVVTNGHGRMPAFGSQIAVNDRWATIAYVRALQLSQHAIHSELSPADQNAIASAAADSDADEGGRP